MKYSEFINEQIKIKCWGKFVRVSKNSPPGLILALLEGSTEKSLRGYIHNGDVYWADAEKVTHDAIAAGLGIQYNKNNGLNLRLKEFGEVDMDYMGEPSIVLTNQYIKKMLYTYAEEDLLNIQDYYKI